jgi:hypothetical protein
MDRIEEVLRAYERSKGRAYGVFLHSKERVDAFANLVTTQPALAASSEANLSIAFEITTAAARDAIGSTLELVTLISALDDTHLTQLVRAPDSVYEAYLAGNSALYDELALRTQVYKYIVLPSPEVKLAHESHCRKLDIDMTI